jgi:hypothetical protein
MVGVTFVGAKYISKVVQKFMVILLKRISAGLVLVIGIQITAAVYEKLTKMISCTVL